MAGRHLGDDQVDINFVKNMANLSFFDLARWYEPLIGWSLSGLREFSARLVRPKSGMKVLDVGCGTGEQLVIYQERGCDVYGIDLSISMLKVAKEKLGNETNLQNCDATELPFEDGVFDLVHSSLFLHQLSPQARSAMLSEAVRVMRPDGNLLLIDFRPVGEKTFKGQLIKYFISVVEFLAGWEHYSNSRHFLSKGGIPVVTKDQHLRMRKEFVVGNGNLGIYLLQYQDLDGRPSLADDARGFDSIYARHD